MIQETVKVGSRTTSSTRETPITALVKMRVAGKARTLEKVQIHGEAATITTKVEIHGEMKTLQIVGVMAVIRRSSGTTTLILIIDLLEKTRTMGLTVTIVTSLGIVTQKGRVGISQTISLIGTTRTPKKTLIVDRKSVV